MRIYNTLTRAKEEFVPLVPGQVRMYVCGVTVYDVSHAGHARSAIVFDVIHRYFGFKGYEVKFVKNYTDVDDKIIRRAQEEGVDATVIAERYIEADERDMAALGVERPDVAPRATQHIGEMLALIERLVTTGHAYVVDGDVYFEIARFPRYGRLGGKNLDELLAGARVEVDERKRDPRDFALWKAAKPGEPSWPSPWGAGRPGWHIECSVMATHYLGQSLDIHGGGTDLIFPHHECEIAQTEADTGRPFARYWVHNGLVNFGAEKMSKSLGNILTIKELVKRHEPDAFRLWLLDTHYRNPVEFSEEHIQASARALERFRRLIAEAVRLGTGDDFLTSRGQTLGGPPPWHALLLALQGQEPLRTHVAVACGEFEEAMDDDFNTPRALAAISGLRRWLEIRRAEAKGLEEHSGPFINAVKVMVLLGRVLGLFEGMAQPQGPPQEVNTLVAEREAARRQRDWKRADALRDEIHRFGWTVEDTAIGPRVVTRGPRSS